MDELFKTDSKMKKNLREKRINSFKKLVGDDNSSEEEEIIKSLINKLEGGEGDLDDKEFEKLEKLKPKKFNMLRLKYQKEREHDKALAEKERINE